jgi:hypothetical protein
MPETKTDAVASTSANAWAGLTAAAPALAGAGSITTTVDTLECPRCGSPAKKMDRNDRACCACGLTWRVVTERDEKDAEADREVRSRGWSAERGGEKRIPRGSTRW